jgi:adenylylsulfate kinase
VIGIPVSKYNDSMNKTFTLWLTGLSGAGKTTLAHEIKKHIQNAVILDGDEVRKGLSSDLTFTDDSRRENIRRVSEVCKILNAQGFPVIVSMISPFEEDRNKAKKCIGDGFRLCYVKCSLEKCRGA